jgi:hypothetical protein
MGAVTEKWMAIMSAREDFEFKIDRLLADWHQWRRSYRFTRGFSGSDGTCRDYRAPGHWDWKNGAADAKADEMEMRAVDEAIERVPNTPHRWKTALEFHAMNLHSGCAVWTSPVLPKTRAEREVLLLEARNMLLVELRRAGALG